MSDVPSEPHQSSVYGDRELANVAAALARDRRPDAIGPYRITDLIGEGGMGSVFRAEQLTPIHRTVALKLIKRGIDGPMAEERFRSEQRLLESIDHPNIARVLDAGRSNTGRPFIVMEFVDGTPLTTYADEHRLSVKERLALLLQVCRAVQHAHQRAILHRDLKPSNILVTEVDGRPVVKVIDFGIAKILEDAATPTHAALTEIGQRVGTIEYMSPEQADGAADIDTRSDVYALGVICYELLAGVTPFGSSELHSLGLVERSRLLNEQEAPRPSTRLMSAAGNAPKIAERRRTSASHLASQLRRELDWIAIKALRRERSERYASVGEMAEDIESFLANRPLRAGPPSYAYRARKFIARHRFPVILVAVAGAVLSAGVAGTVWQAVRATRAEALIRLEQQQTIAERAKAIDAADAAQSVRDFLVEMLNSADPDIAQGREITVRDVLDSAAATIDDRFAGRPRVEAELRSTLGQTYTTLGVLDKAETHLLKAVELLVGIDDVTPRERLRAQLRVATLRVAQDRLGEARQIASAVYDESRQRFGEDDELVADAGVELAVALERMGELEAAEGLFRSVIEADVRNGRDQRRSHFIALGNLGQMLRPLQRFDEAEQLLARAYAGMVSVAGKDDPVAIDMLGTYADTLRYTQQFDRAESMMREYMERSERVFGADHYRSIVAEQGLAVVLESVGRKEESLQHFRSALERMRRVMGETHTETLWQLQTFAAKRTNDRALDDAESLFREAFEGWSAVAGSDHPNAIGCLHGLTQVLCMQDKWSEALEPARMLYDAAIDPTRVQVAPARRARYLSMFGIVLARLDRPSEAVAPLEVAFEALRDTDITSRGNLEAYRSVINSLVHIAETSGDMETASRWRRELDRFNPPLQ